MRRAVTGEVTNVQKMKYGRLQHLRSSVWWFGYQTICGLVTRKDECACGIGMIPLCLSQFCFVYSM
jgi:hypothetical protein